MVSIEWPKYSQLCETSESAYVEYLQACSRVADAYIKSISENSGSTCGSLSINGRIVDPVGARCGDIGASGLEGGVDCGSKSVLLAGGRVSGVRTLATTENFVDIGKSGSNSEGAAVGHDRGSPNGSAYTLGQEGRGAPISMGMGERARAQMKRGPNFERNKADRERKKAARAQRKVARGNDELDISVRDKWVAKNRLEKLRAEREIAVLTANDVADEVKCFRTRVVAATERNMVSIEKTHGRLREAGDVTSDDDSRVQTLLSDGSSETPKTISPDSSASQAEVRAMQKELLDLKAGIVDLGIDPALLPFYKKTAWTVGSNRRLTADQEAILDRIYPDGYAVGADSIHGDDGKRMVPVYDY